SPLANWFQALLPIWRRSPTVAYARTRNGAFNTWQISRSLFRNCKEEPDLGTPAGPRLVVRPTQRTWIWVGAAFVLVAIAAAGWLVRRTARKPQPAPEVVPLTSYAGSEKSPSFSPDGDQVAFSWNGEKQDNFHIYVKLIASPTPERLTVDPAADVSPA